MEHVEHGLHEEGKDVHFDPQDMRNMGGLKKYMPSTYWTFMIATIAIAGIPPLAGFFSKDEILVMAFNAGMGEFAGTMYTALWVVGMITAFLTAFYMFRLTLGTFHGSFKLPQRIKEAVGAESYLHESPASMTIPLWSLAGLSIVGGFFGVPNFIVETFTHEEAHINLLHTWLYGPLADIPLTLSHGIEWTLMITSILVAVAGVWVAYRMYGADNAEASDKAVEERFGYLYSVWSSKYNLDEIYEGYIGNPIVRFSDRVLAVFDMRVVDGFVNAIAGTVKLFGSLIRYIQTGVTSSYAMALVIGVVIVLSVLIF
jgi:NADH-quinone oxidoreductase subunit L